MTAWDDRHMRLVKAISENPGHHRRDLCHETGVGFYEFGPVLRELMNAELVHMSESGGIHPGSGDNRDEWRA